MIQSSLVSVERCTCVQVSCPPSRFGFFPYSIFLLTFKQKKGSGGPWEPFEKAKGLRGHEGHACQEAAGWEKGKVKLCADSIPVWMEMRCRIVFWTASTCFPFCIQVRKVTRKLIYKRAEKYHKEYRQMYRREIRMGRMARKVGNFYVPAEPKLAFVIRIRGWVMRTAWDSSVSGLKELHNQLQGVVQAVPHERMSNCWASYITTLCLAAQLLVNSVAIEKSFLLND